ncbi:hypothetical protein ACFQE0_00635 [Methylobacterium komagatae]|uniref:Uncharacterized protein n=1 Tax=Methylobacterium komagatae TaxID=374425 RepID=A0ABW2BDV9_9HYPH
MNLTISPSGRGKHHARLGDRLITTSYTPLFSAARILLQEGVSGEETLTMTHEGSEAICMRTTVGTAARLTVQDDARGFGFRRYRPGPSITA